MDKANQKRKRAADKARSVVRDRRRFKVTPVPTGEARVVVKSDTATTIFPSTVLDPKPGDDVLVDGRDHVKLGGDVLVGRVKGARLFTLSLVERETCPRACTHWRDCYTNAMPFLRRWRHGPQLEACVRDQVTRLCGAHTDVVVRLHMSGDFYSFDYLAMWVKLVDAFDNLTVFGFTAWQPGTKIGDGVARVREAMPERFAVRTSNVTGEWGSFTIDFPTERRYVGDAVVCPEQRDAMDTGERRKHCGNCGLCWQTNRPIVFVEH